MGDDSGQTQPGNAGDPLAEIEALQADFERDRPAGKLIPAQQTAHQVTQPKTGRAVNQAGEDQQRADLQKFVASNGDRQHRHDQDADHRNHGHHAVKPLVAMVDQVVKHQAAKNLPITASTSETGKVISNSSVPVLRSSDHKRIDIAGMSSM